jgi:hypothetical protein
MIQRIQTIYLLIGTFLLALLYSNPIAEIVVSDTLYLTLWHYKIVSVNSELFTAQSTWPITVLLSVVIIIQVASIFLYRKRQLQIRLGIFSILLMFGLLGMIYFFTKYTLHTMDGVKSVFLWPVVCPMIAVILNYLAIKAIQKDEKLVRSYERIR